MSTISSIEIHGVGKVLFLCFKSEYIGRLEEWILHDVNICIPDHAPCELSTDRLEEEVEECCVSGT